MGSISNVLVATVLKASYFASFEYMIKSWDTGDSKIKFISSTKSAPEWQPIQNLSLLPDCSFKNSIQTNSGWGDEIFFNFKTCGVAEALTMLNRKLKTLKAMKIWQHVIKLAQTFLEYIFAKRQIN